MNLANASLVLGLIGLFTAGLLGIGSLIGLFLGFAALAQSRRDPQRQGGSGVAVAGVVSNVFALLTIIPVGVLLLALRSTGVLSGDDNLPQPIPGSTLASEPSMAPPPPPPPPPPRTPTAATGGVREDQPGAEGIRVGGEIKEPKKLRNVSPVYPLTAREARVQGIVILEATIAPSGQVSEVRVLRSIPLLDEAAVEAVRQWVYTPTLLNGVAVPVIMTVTVDFKLN